MNSIPFLRNKIDEIDRQLALLLADRCQLADQVWQIKKASGIEFIDLGREQQMVQQISKYLTQSGVESGTQHYVAEIYKMILDKNRLLLAQRVQR